MRLRSSQFVFLLLLVCTVQVPEEHALRWMAGVVSRPASDESRLREPSSTVVGRNLRPDSEPDIPAAIMPLDAASKSAHRIPWDMRRPALAAAAVSSHTSMLRA